MGEPRASVLAVLTRAPSAGGKTRLFGALGRPADRALLAALLLDTLAAAEAPGVARVVAVTPEAARDEVAALVPAGVGVTGQSGGDLGARMRGVMAALFAAGARRVAVIGSDLPDLPPGVVEEAFHALEADPAQLVLGPSADGGYYLIAATRVPPVFDGVGWGGPGVLAATTAAAGAAGWPVRLLREARDVDTPDDLRRAAASGRAPRTAAWARAALAAR